MCVNFVKFLNDILRVFLNYVKYLLLYGSNGSSTVLLLSQDMTQNTDTNIRGTSS